MFLDIHGDSDFVFSGYVGSISFVILLESLWFLFVLHHQYLIATSCLFFFSFCLFRGRRQCVLICFPSSGTSRIYIYIFKSLTKQDKIYKKFTLLCGFVSSPLSVHQSLESLFNLFFFSAFCTIYNWLPSLFGSFSSSHWRFSTLHSKFPANICSALQSTELNLISLQQQYTNGEENHPQCTPSDNS